MIMTDYTLLFVATGSFCVGTLFYYLYRNNRNLYIELQNAPRHVVDKHLLNTVSKVGYVGKYVAVEGQVQADWKSIRGIYNKDVEGVIQNVFVKEYTKQRDDKLTQWNRSSEYLSKGWNVENFSLCSSSGRIRVSVRNPLSVNELPMKTVFDKYEPVSVSVAEKLLDYLTGHRVVGIRTVERMLLTNSKLTAVGKLICHDGQMYIDKPDGGLRYYLTKDSVDSLIKSEESTTAIKRYVSYIFFGIGGVVFAFWLYKLYENYVENLQYSRLEIENSSDDCCVICLVRERDIVLIPCGHICVCSTCVRSVNNICPMCRRDIERLVPMFRS